MIRKYARAARENTGAALPWLAFEPAGRYLNWRRKRMNYTQAYKALRNFGVNANKARMLLDTSAETGTDTLGAVTVIFDGDGFTISEKE